MRILKVPLLKRGITFNEVPDKMAVYFELGDCEQGCKGCHSPELQNKCTEFVDSNDMVSFAVDQIDAGANAIVVLGGTTARSLTSADMVSLLQDLALIAPVCLYSGSDNDVLDKQIASLGNCTWLKTGSYQEAKGGLQSRTTNQRFYTIKQRYHVDGQDNLVGIETEFIDETYKFWKNGRGE